VALTAPKNVIEFSTYFAKTERWMRSGHKQSSTLGTCGITNKGRCNQHPFPQLSCSGMLPRVADPRLPLCTIQGHMTLKDQKAHEAVDGEEQVQAEWQVTVQCLCLLL
jgi:hypothetical protein